MELKTNAIYRHFKGDLYLVVDIAVHSETGEKLVIYRSLYGNLDLYARAYDMFIEKVDKIKYPDVLQEYRFEYTEIESLNCK